MKIKFTFDVEYDGKFYKRGEVYDIADEKGIPQRWLKRGCIEVKEEPKAEVIPTINSEVEEVALVEEVDKEIEVQKNKNRKRKNK